MPPVPPYPWAVPDGDRTRFDAVRARCTACGSAYDAMAPTQVNVAEQPGLATALALGELFATSCPTCDARIDALPERLRWLDPADGLDVTLDHPTASDVQRAGLARALRITSRHALPLPDAHVLGLALQRPAWSLYEFRQALGRPCTGPLRDVINGLHARGLLQLRGSNLRAAPR
ncbi:MAG: CpXC domain-containing protein [Halobacteriales archaeon]|nr:CpXC domain-containing protein [Halobacteriales archaeon]